MPHRFDLAAIGAGLVVAEAADAIERAAGAGAAVVTAPPGTGKTTFVPPLVANLLLARSSGATPDAGAPTVLLTQPRRVAVRAAAARIAHLDGSPVGGAVGFTVRGERVLDPGHRLEALTPGVLLRRLLAEPDLPGVGAVILDEVHERSVDGDLLLGMLAEVRELRDDLVVVAMSATLNAQRVADLLGAAGAPAPIVEVPSALHPLRVEYAPCERPRLDERGVTREFLAHLAAVAAEAQRADGCDALVFVPGAREVDELVRLLRARVDAIGGGVEVLALHGRLDAHEQDRAVRGAAPGDPPRIVVSTSLAESSLTVPGVRLVVDAGLAREVRRDQARSMTGLVTGSASRASAVQRAGRAARLGPGCAVRAYSESDFARMPADAPPEIASADLTDAALLLAAWGTPRGDGLALLTRPPEPAMHEAEGVLRALELVDAAGGITALGRRIAPLPVGAREARALLAGCAELGDPSGVAEVVAAMAGDFRDPDSDLARVLAELRAGRAPGAGRWRVEARRLLRIAAAHAGDDAQRHETSGDARRHETGGDARRRDAPGGVEPGAVLALARPEWIARRVDAGSRAYLLASGTRAALPEGSPLLASSWIAVREVQRADGRAADGTGAVIRLAAALHEDDALRFGAALRTDRRAARIAQGRVQVRQERRLGAILLSSTPVAASAADTAPAIALMLRDEGLASLPWSEPARGLRARLALLHAELGSPWPDVGDAALIDDLEAWLGPDVERFSGGSALRSLDLATALRRLLPWPDAARFEQLAPERLAVPSGGSARIVYPEPGTGAERPIVAVKLQEVFGLARTPALVDGRVPVLFHLLSPARRPLAVTDDLESFWNGPYQQVRKEMRGRYPKHPWPEDPWSAPATARTKRASTP